jgi:hypothetical protein
MLLASSGKDAQEDTEMNDWPKQKPAPCPIAAPETLESLMTRDLAAWREARALIERAKRS